MKGIKAIEGLSFALKDKWQDKVICKSENEKHTIAELLEIVYKDLEILDILKNESDSKRIIERDGIVSFHLDIILTTDNYNKIKEWLENGKNDR